MIYKIGDSKVGINQILRMRILKLKNTNTIQFKIETAKQEYKCNYKSKQERTEDKQIELKILKHFLK